MSKFFKFLFYSSTALLFSFSAAAQAVTYSVYPTVQCYNASNIYTINAGIFVQQAGASYYQWTITSNNNCTATFTNGQYGGQINVVNTGSQIAITASCCGQYTCAMMPYNIFGSPILSGYASGTFQIVCPYSPTVVTSASTACEGQSITVSELGGNAPGNYNWYVNGSPLTTTASSIALTPSVNTCITFSPNAVQGCTNALISAACVSVQSSQLALGNQSYTVCNNVPICLTLPVQTNTNVASGTSIPSITWFAANNSTLASPCMTAAIPGTYTALVSHTGVAGTCTRTSMLSIATGSALSVSVSPSLSSICNSNDSIPLFATSVQSVSSSYTWSLPNGTLSAVTQTGSAIFGTANILTGSTTVYTVNTNYFGCAGSNTVAIKPFIINPVLLATSNSICLGNSASLSTSVTAGQLSNYTINFFGPGTIGINTNSLGIANVLPNFLPATYTVSVDSANCAAQSTITIYKKLLQPILQLSNDTTCKNTAVTMTCQNVGYQASNSYTFGTLSPFTSTVGTAIPTFSFATHYPTVTTVYYAIVDSSGCSNSFNTAATATIFVKPDLQLFPNYSSATVCPGTALNLSVSTSNPNSWPVTYTWTQSAGTGTIIGNTTASSVQAHPITASVFSVNAIDSMGCVGDTSIIVAIDSNLGFPMLLSASSNPICVGEAMLLSSSLTTSIMGLPLSYSWSPAAASISTMNTQSVSVTPTTSTIYTLVATNQYGCRNQSTISITIDACVGITYETRNQHSILVSPNPTTDFITLILDEKALLICYKVDNSVVFKKDLTSGEHVLDLSELKSGLYLFEFILSANPVYKKIIVR